MSRSKRRVFFGWTIRFFVKGHEWQGSRTWTTHLSLVQWEPPEEAKAECARLRASGLVSRLWAVGPGGQVEFDSDEDEEAGQ